MEIIEIRFEWFLLNQKWEETEKSTQIHRQTEFDWDKYGKNKNLMKIYDAPPIRGIEMKKKNRWAKRNKSVKYLHFASDSPKYINNGVS